MKIQAKDNTMQITPGCDLIASQVEKLRDGILKKLKKEPPVSHVIFDVAGVQVVDSLGVNLIVGTFRQCESQSATFEIVNGNDKFMRIAAFFKFEDFFKVTAENKTS